MFMILDEITNSKEWNVRHSVKKKLVFGGIFLMALNRMWLSQTKDEIRIFMIRHKHDKFDGFFYVWKPVRYRKI